MMVSPLSTLMGILLFAVVVVTGQANAAGGGTDTSNNVSTSFIAAEAAVEAGDYEDAIAKLTQVIAEEPQNADAYNYLGYSNRKLGHFDRAGSWYAKALEINPEHLGANEYLGELYVQTGQMDKAEAQLKILEGLCFFGCREYDQLKKSIADAQKRSGG